MRFLDLRNDVLVMNVEVMMRGIFRWVMALVRRCGGYEWDGRCHIGSSSKKYAGIMVASVPDRAVRFAVFGHF